jgi:hypothetical protein
VSRPSQVVVVAVVLMVVVVVLVVVLVVLELVVVVVEVWGVDSSLGHPLTREMLCKRREREQRSFV